MEKKNYYTPEVKFHQLRGNAVMQEASLSGEGSNQGGNDQENDAKGFSSISFDEDE